MIVGQSLKAPANDPYLSSVKLLMGFEDANGSTGAPGFTDESPAAHGTASQTADAPTISTAQFAFGSSSGLFVNGSCYFADSADWTLGTGPFTIEARVRLSFAAGTEFIIGQWPLAGTDLAWVLYTQDGGGFGPRLSFNVSTNGADNIAQMEEAATMSVNTWYAVAVDFDGVTYRLYRDGAMVSSSKTLRTINDSTDSLAIGANTTGGLNGNCWQGNIDEVRVTKGVARYANDAGYSPRTTAFPRV